MAGDSRPDAQIEAGDSSTGPTTSAPDGSEAMDTDSAHPAGQDDRADRVDAAGPDGSGEDVAGPDDDASGANGPGDDGTGASGPGDDDTRAAGPDGSGDDVAGPDGSGDDVAGPDGSGDGVAGPDDDGTGATGPDDDGTGATGPDDDGTGATGPDHDDTVAAEPDDGGDDAARTDGSDGDVTRSAPVDASEAPSATGSSVAVAGPDTPDHRRAGSAGVTGSDGRWSSLRADLRDVWACAVGAVLVLAVVEITATVVAGVRGPSVLSVATVIRFAILAVALVGLSLPLIAVGLFLASTSWRVLRRLSGGAKPGASGLLTPLAPGPRPAMAWFWGAGVASLVFAAGSALATVTIIPRFQALALTAVLLALVQLFLVGVAVLVGLAARAAAARVGEWLDRSLGRGAWVNPLSRPLAALLATALFVGLACLAIALSSPRMAPIVPWRALLSLLAVALGVLGARMVRARGVRLPATRSQLVAAVIFYLAFVPSTLVWWGAHSGAKALAVTASPVLSALVDGVRKANDIDGDGFGSLLGETDCDPFNAAINPLAPEIADNGVDENCDGRDLELARLKVEPGTTAPVPEAFRRDWNILLLTIDTVRYDHTSFGGYRRDTTPELEKLVKRSVSFSFAQAPSAGTMASIPAILTSKFFHSGIALGPNRRGKPPLMKPENLLISEALKSAGYTTGALLTHYYFNEWGLDQGFDTYDNSLGRKNNPKLVAADRLTDRAVAWIANNAGKKWFLWAHYIDPHGHYVDHPGEVSYGSSEEDLYDGELRFTDKHVGRLLRELSRISGVPEKTIIIVTSDHGDGFNEHGFTSHAKALYFELLHVPLIIYIPSIQPRVVPGPVSPLDIFPTVLDLTGIDRSRLRFEGKSLVPQLFYGEDARDRVVFAETDYPKPQRAVISDRYKLVRRLQDDLYELFDLEADPREQRNLHPPRTTEARRAFETMNRHLEDWLERVYYSRDQTSNQLMMYLAEVLLAEAPTPTHRFEGVTYDGGRIEVLGYDVEPARPRQNQRAKVAVYFRVSASPSDDFKLQLVAAAERTPQRTRAAFTAKGRFPTSRWRPGEHIRDEREIRLRADLYGEVELGLRLVTHSGQTLEPDAGPRMIKDPKSLKLGTITVEPSTSGGSDPAKVP